MKKIVHHIRRFHAQAGSSSRNLLLALVGVSLLGMGAYAGVNQFKPLTQPQQPAEQAVSPTVPQEESPKAESPHTVIYGVWVGNNSLIKAYNLETKNAYVLAELPQNVKRVTAKMPDKLYYINDTNELDHGKEIIRNTFGGTPQTIVKADEGFGIDDYFISQEGNFITTWEVQVARRDALYGGKSRVYSINVNNPTVKNLIYDEVADKPIHYPRGVTNNGTVITDMFLPNSGPGWGYGMSTSDVSGKTKLDSTVMANGTYGRQPRVSEDGSMLAVAGYDGTKGSGTEQMEGIRKAIVMPNTVEIVDANTLQRKKLTNISNKFLYDDTKVDRGGKHLLISQIKYINKMYKPHVLVYDLENNTATEVPNSIDKRGFAVLSDTQLFVSTPNVTGQTLGNLGETYQFLNSEFGVINPKDGKFVTLPMNDNNMQFIGLFPNSEIAVSSAFTDANAEANRDALQLHSFVLKTNLLPNRINLQSTSMADSNRGTVSRTLGIKTVAQVPITPVDRVVPIIPFGFTPGPGTPIPSVSRRPGDLPAPPDSNNQPINNPDNNNNAPNQTPNVVSQAPMNPISQAPIGGVSPAPDGENQNPNVPQIPGNGEIPDDPEGLIELIRQLLGILEEQAQN